MKNLLLLLSLTIFLGCSKSPGKKDYLEIAKYQELCAHYPIGFLAKISPDEIYGSDRAYKLTLYTKGMEKGHYSRTFEENGYYVEFYLFADQEGTISGDYTHYYPNKRSWPEPLQSRSVPDYAIVKAPYFFSSRMSTNDSIPKAFDLQKWQLEKRVHTSLAKISIRQKADSSYAAQILWMVNEKVELMNLECENINWQEAML
ncbi:hypothetical protein [Persicobacter diffluens]|uniref:Uncharacterized protein n=1 Tax=Persicobacter diffluens TaxID=981 RepID=A0AAN4VVW2_9BACT|nr:hypothetical protein PEDI_14880 [Persicobacter diffluens]